MAQIILQGISRRVTQDFQYAKEWLEMHALAEELYPKYVRLHYYMSLCKLANELQSREQTDIHKSIATNYFREVVQPQSISVSDDLKQLSSIYRTTPVSVLRNLPRCLPAITQSLDSHPNSTLFYNGALLIERICELILDAMHTASTLLREYFDSLEAG
ncbi:MAG: hypothetical protein F6K16_18860 [Symploca sp. SIO2B6]|nr:hypothetical protein [Symploca sp. SIO2B6]